MIKQLDTIFFTVTERCALQVGNFDVSLYHRLSKLRSLGRGGLLFHDWVDISWVDEGTLPFVRKDDLLFAQGQSNFG